MSPDPDEMSSIDLQKLVESEIKSKNSYIESMPADFAFEIRDKDEQDVDFRKELGRWKSDIILFTREFGTEKICILIPIRDSDYKNYGISRNNRDEISDDNRDENIDDDEISDDNGDDDEISDNDSDGDEISDNSSHGDENSGGGGGRRGPPASFKIQVEITKANGKTLRLIVSAPGDDVTVESMSIKFQIDDGFHNAAEYMVDKDGGLQSGLKEYLKSRGIKKSGVDFMYEYVVRKTKQAPMRALDGLQVFMEA